MTTTNLLGNIHFLCNRNHTTVDEVGNEKSYSLEMIGDKMGYVCPKHYPISEDNQYGYNDYYHETKCLNYIRTNEVLKVSDYIQSEYENAILNGEVLNLTNFKFKLKFQERDNYSTIISNRTVQFTVVLHDENNNFFILVEDTSIDKRNL